MHAYVVVGTGIIIVVVTASSSCTFLEVERLDLVHVGVISVYFVHDASLRVRFTGVFFQLVWDS